MILSSNRRLRRGLIAGTLALVLNAAVTVCYSQARNAGNHAAKRDPRAFLSQPLTIGWRYNSDLTLNLTPAFDRDRVYLPLAGGIIVSLKAGDGTLNWRSEFGGELSASPVADDRDHIQSGMCGLGSLPSADPFRCRNRIHAHFAGLVQ